MSDKCGGVVNSSGARTRDNSDNEPHLCTKCDKALQDCVTDDYTRSKAHLCTNYGGVWNNSGSKSEETLASNNSERKLQLCGKCGVVLEETGVDTSTNRSAYLCTKYDGVSMERTLALNINESKPHLCTKCGGTSDGIVAETITKGNEQNMVYAKCGGVLSDTGISKEVTFEHPNSEAKLHLRAKCGEVLNVSDNKCTYAQSAEGRLMTLSHIPVPNVKSVVEYCQTMLVMPVL